MEQIPAEVLNASVSTVTQSITLFSDSIRDNLTMWNDSISESDMIAAAKDACIHDVISQKPGAYDFRLGGGQPPICPAGRDSGWRLPALW